MSLGVESALGEITLVLFTTLGPAGVLAFCIVGLFTVFGALSSEDRMRSNRYLIVPLSVVLISLIASATHLGSPNNALYVLTGIGRSPLSNEVGSGLLFLSFAGIYWLAAFSSKEYRIIRRVLMLFITASGLLFVALTSLAYSVDTIPTWNSAHAPVCQWLYGIILSVFISLLTFKWAELECPSAFKKVLLVCALMSLVASVIVLFIWNSELVLMRNSWLSIARLLPNFLLYVAIYVLLQLLAFALVLPEVFWPSRYKRSFPLIACLFSSAGVFIMRFIFYVMRMTTGI